MHCLTLIITRLETTDLSHISPGIISFKRIWREKIALTSKISFFYFHSWSVLLRGKKKSRLCALRLEKYMTFGLLNKLIYLKINPVNIPTHFGKKQTQKTSSMWQILKRVFSDLKMGQKCRIQEMLQRLHFVHSWYIYSSNCERQLPEFSMIGEMK